MEGEDVIEVHGQEGGAKGLRLIRFRPDGPTSLRWLGPVGEPDCETQFRYSRYELAVHGWEFVEEIAED